MVTVATIACHHWPLTERRAEVRAAIERWVAAQAPASDQQPAREVVP